MSTMQAARTAISGRSVQSDGSSWLRGGEVMQLEGITCDQRRTPSAATPSIHDPSSELTTCCARVSDV